MTTITKAAPELDTPTLRELVTRLALEIDPEAKLEAFPEALAFQIDMARAVIRAAQPAPVVPEPLIVKGAMAGMVDAQVRDLWPTNGAALAASQQKGGV